MDNDNGVNLEPNYIWEIQDWAKERGLDKSNNDKQLIRGHLASKLVTLVTRELHGVFVKEEDL